MKLKVEKGVPLVYSLIGFEGDESSVKLLVDTKNSGIIACSDSKIIFENMLDFRFSNEHGFLEREELSDINYKSGVLFQVLGSSYIEYYLSMFPASEVIHPNMKYYFLRKL